MSDHDGTQTHSPVGPENPGLAGRMAGAFIDSPLSPLLFVSLLFLGLIGLAVTPRQEDPQISVPMVDIFVQYQGASASQVSSLAIEPLERIMSEIPGVEHVYSASRRGQGMVTVQFFVGEPLGPSIVKVHDKIQSNLDKIPPGVSPPLVKPKGIDDVPVVTLTLWSPDPGIDDSTLRKLALDILQVIKEIPDTGQGFIVGGRSEQVKVEVFPQRLSGHGISLDQVAETIRTANAEQQAGNLEAANTHFSVYTGAFLRTAEDIARLVVGSRNDVPIYVRDVARVVHEAADTREIVEYYTGPAGDHEAPAAGAPAVTLAVAKKEGSNGVEVAQAILAKVESLKGVEGGLIPANVKVEVTRNYGETSNDKVNELIGKLFKATGFVFLLVLVAFVALRPALVVLLVIPVVILFTVFAAFLMGYTIDRVSLFALIFSIGILVDDAIVVVENIYRRWLEADNTSAAVAVDAVREVGNPTIIATFTVVAALLPMGFVRGMMGPYMEPIPALGSVAMLVSLVAAFIFTPWWAMRLKPGRDYLMRQEKREHRMADRLDGIYRHILIPLIEHKGKRLLFRVALWGSLVLALSMFYTTAVTVKMLPLDNKPEFSLVINMPEGTALPVTANLTRQIAQRIRAEVPHVVALQTYVGTARPFDFNGMVRHYYLRGEPWQAEIQVQLTHKSQRDESSHDLAVLARELVASKDSDLWLPIMQSGARIAVVEMPPGPPVLQTVVAEIHGPTPDSRRRFAYDMTRMFEEAENLADVDNYMEETYYYWRFEVDTEKAVRRGISVDTINRNVAMAMGGYTLGDIKLGRVLEPTHIVIQVPLAQRAQISRLKDLPIPTANGTTVPLGELGRFLQVPEDPTIYHKDLRAVEYVTAESVGRLAAPIYGMLQVEEQVAASERYAHLADNFWGVAGHYTGAPADDTRPGFEWAGEWTVTYETFRDLGIAFAAALLLIYILVVWEFSNFRVPLLIMAPIPLTLLGIIPGHWLMGAEFTATSMIGWIALAGIIVRNSILLVDFAIHAIRAGAEVREAVIQACTTRTRPIMITALALVAGSSVILGDPIFKGMAISLAFGVMVSTILTLIVIPLGAIAASDSLIQLAQNGGGHPGGAAPSPDDHGGGGPGAPGKRRPFPTPAFREKLATAGRAAGAGVAAVGRALWQRVRRLWQEDDEERARRLAPKSLPKARPVAEPPPVDSESVAVPGGNESVADAGASAPAHPTEGNAATPPPPVAQGDLGPHATDAPAAEPPLEYPASRPPEAAPHRTSVSAMDVAPAPSQQAPGLGPSAAAGAADAPLEASPAPAAPKGATPTRKVPSKKRRIALRAATRDARGAEQPAPPASGAAATPAPGPEEGTPDTAASHRPGGRKRRGIRLKANVPGLREDRRPPER